MRKVRGKWMVAGWRGELGGVSERKYEKREGGKGSGWWVVFTYSPGMVVG